MKNIGNAIGKNLPFIIVGSLGTILVSAAFGLKPAQKAKDWLSEPSRPEDRACYYALQGYTESGKETDVTVTTPSGKIHCTVGPSP